MHDLELASWSDLKRRVDSIAKSLEQIYQVQLRTRSQEISLENLYPTEDFLENDKLALVLKKTVEENYNVPITAVNRLGDNFILDGHHRAFILKKLLRTTINACVLEFPEGKLYREVPKRPLESLRIEEVCPIEDPILRTWQRILSVVKHYEAIYDTPFRLRETSVNVEDLVPTQTRVAKTQIESIKGALVPIVCVYQREKYYIVDGHARSLRAKELCLKSIKAMVLTPPQQIDFGIARTADEWGLRSLEDVAVIEYFPHI
jgi:IMP dehydrogenase